MAKIIDEIKKDIKKVADVAEEVVEKIEDVAEDIVEGVEKAVGLKEKSSTDDNEKVDVAEAEKESTDEKTVATLEEKKKKILEKAAKLKGKITGDVVSTEELKEQIKIKKRADMLVPLEEYVKAGIYLGTKVVTPQMKPFVYRRRADGLAIFNTDLIDEKLKEGVDFLSKFNAEDIVLACKRQAGWKAAQMFSKLTGIRIFTKKYPAGILTNTELPNFFENELTVVFDSWLDKNALNDTLNVKKKILMICDTNNFAKGADQVIIGNNKSARSLGLIFYLLTKGYCKAKKIECDIPDLEWWTGEIEE